MHNWWHLALYELEAGRPERSLAIYDAEVHNGSSLGVPIEMLDASALLWRMLLDGVDTGGRFGALADAWAPKAADLSRGTCSTTCTRRWRSSAPADLPRPTAWSAALDRWLDTAAGTNARMTAEIGLPACRAVIAFGEQRDGDVIAELLPIRRVLQHFGGSHAQRDALQRTLLESALRSGRFELARALTAERLGVRERSVYSWTQRAPRAAVA